MHYSSVVLIARCSSSPKWIQLPHPHHIHLTLLRMLNTVTNVTVSYVKQLYQNVPVGMKLPIRIAMRMQLRESKATEREYTYDTIAVI